MCIVWTAKVIVIEWSLSFVAKTTIQLQVRIKGCDYTRVPSSAENLIRVFSLSQFHFW